MLIEGSISMKVFSQDKPVGANRYSVSTGIYYKYVFKGLLSKMWNGRLWVDAAVPVDAIRV